MWAGVRSHGVQLRTPARPTSLARPWSVAGTLTGRLSPAVAAENFGHHLFLQFTDLYAHPFDYKSKVS